MKTITRNEATAIIAEVLGWHRKGSSREIVWWYEGEVCTGYTENKQHRIGKLFNPLAEDQVHWLFRALEAWLSKGRRNFDIRSINCLVEGRRFECEVFEFKSNRLGYIMEGDGYNPNLSIAIATAICSAHLGQQITIEED